LAGLSGRRKGEAKLQTWINDWVSKNKQNGNLAAIYKKFHS
jgi:polar amino acid transport system substrate-binding protein